MKNPMRRFALFIATLFVSALPLTSDARDVDDKEKNHYSPVIHVAKTIHKYRRILNRNSVSNSRSRLIYG
jgi:hypothetical protein